MDYRQLKWYLSYVTRRILIVNNIVMNRDDITSELARKLLRCWYLDLEFLISLIEEFSLDIDVLDRLTIKDNLESINTNTIKNNYWYQSLNNINIIIYSCFSEIKDKFLKRYSKEIESIHWVSINNFNDFTIYTDSLDSHLLFHNDIINSLYEKWRYNLDNNNSNNE